MRKTSSIDMIHGPLMGNILLFSLPLMASNFLQLLFNAVDVVVVGRFAGYASLAAEVAVEAGDQVTAGQTVGFVGNTALMENAIGDHVHFSVSCDGEAVDPMAWLE